MEGTNDCNRPWAAKERLLKRKKKKRKKKKKKEEEEEKKKKKKEEEEKKEKKKRGQEDERGNVPESYLGWIYLRVRRSPGTTPSGEPVLTTQAKGQAPRFTRT